MGSPALLPIWWASSAALGQAAGADRPRQTTRVRPGPARAQLPAQLLAPWRTAVLVARPGRARARPCQLPAGPDFAMEPGQGRKGKTRASLPVLLSVPLGTPMNSKMGVSNPGTATCRFWGEPECTGDQEKSGLEETLWAAPGDGACLLVWLVWLLCGLLCNKQWIALASLLPSSAAERGVGVMVWAEDGTEQQGCCPPKPS